MTTEYSVLSKTAIFFRAALPDSTRAHKTVKVLLLFSAVIHAAEFIVCAFFYEQFSTPFFISPVSTLLNGADSFLYAHSIIRQYGFFVVQLSLLAVFAATNPTAYRRLIWILALSRLLMAGLGGYAFWRGAISLGQFLPSLTIDVALAALLLRFAPREKIAYSVEAELAPISDKIVLGARLTALGQRRAVQCVCAIAGGLWMLWGLGSTAFWETGVANISSDKSAEMNLLNAMSANFIVRNQQGVMLLSIGAATAIGAYFPLLHLRIMDFVIAQQFINALSAAVELLFGTILLPQFLTVFSVQVATFLLFYFLYPNARAATEFKNDTTERM